jgi:hypothetical protein
MHQFWLSNKHTSTGLSRKTIFSTCTNELKSQTHMPSTSHLLGWLPKLLQGRQRRARVFELHIHTLLGIWKFTCKMHAPFFIIQRTYLNWPVYVAVNDFFDLHQRTHNHKRKCFEIDSTLGIWIFICKTDAPILIIQQTYLNWPVAENDFFDLHKTPFTIINAQAFWAPHWYHVLYLNIFMSL